MFEERTPEAVPLEESRSLADSPQERRLARSTEATITDVFAGDWDEGAGFNVPLRVDVERLAPGTRAPVLQAIFVVRKLIE